MIRIAIITHNVAKGDGQSRVAYELARYAHSKGNQVCLLADHVDEDLRKLVTSWIPVRPASRLTHLTKVAEFALRANRELRALRHNIDIVQAFGFVLSESHTVNNSQFVHDAWRRSRVHTSRLRSGPYGVYQWLYSWMNTRWERVAYKRARVVVASSRLIERQLINSGVDSSRIRVILNGVDLDEFRPGTEKRQKWGLPEHVPIALFVGDIRTPRKNLETVLRALCVCPDVHLAVVGDTRRSPYMAMAAQMGIQARVHFLGFRSDVAEIMRATDVFVFPSRYEACSLVLLEALASGLPVVTAETAGGAEVVTKDCGVVAEDPDDVDAVAAAIRVITTDPVVNARMKLVAREVAEVHSWSRMAAQYVNLYTELHSSGHQ